MMDYSSAISSQYLASLEMLKQVIERCPESIWNSGEDKTKFWQIAYHALFYTHLYLQNSLDEFTPWSKHRDEYESLQAASKEDKAAREVNKPYEKSDVLEYLAFCQGVVRERVPQLDPQAESGFYWLRFNKLEMQLYNIRHLQQHTGELMERVGTRAGVEIDWVAMVAVSEL